MNTCELQAWADRLPASPDTSLGTTVATQPASEKGRQPFVGVGADEGSAAANALLNRIYN